MLTMNSSFGHWLKQQRRSLDLTQAQLAEQVGCSSLSARVAVANNVHRRVEAARVGDAPSAGACQRAADDQHARRPAASRWRRRAQTTQRQGDLLSPDVDHGPVAVVAETPAESVEEHA